MDERTITRDMVLGALSTVQEPEFHNDLVSLNMIRDIQIDGGKVSFSIMLTTPACPLKNQIESESRAAVEAIPGVNSPDTNLHQPLLCVCFSLSRLTRPVSEIKETVLECPVSRATAKAASADLRLGP